MEGGMQGIFVPFGIKQKFRKETLVKFCHNYEKFTLLWLYYTNLKQNLFVDVDNSKNGHGTRDPQNCCVNHLYLSSGLWQKPCFVFKFLKFCKLCVVASVM